MSQAKGKHYWTQLRAALTGGHWGSSTPAKAYNGAPLSWSELLRKFNKHNHGYHDVAEIASQTQALALFIAGSPSERDLDRDACNPAGPLVLGDECFIAEGRRQEAAQSVEALKNLECESPNSDSLKLLLACYEFALGRPEECLSYLKQVRDLADAHGRLNPSTSVRSTGSSALALQVPSVSGDSSVSFTGSFVSIDSSASVADIRDGRAWAAVEVIRSICLQGMCYEILMPNEPDKTLPIYLNAVQNLPTLEAEISRTSPPNPLPTTGTGQAHLEYTSFTRYRELWRWVERLLWRAIIIASRVCHLGGSDESILWSLFAHYQTCSAHWPPTFRTEHRSTISTLYLRALVLRSRLPGLPPLPSNASINSAALDPTTAAWLPAARRAVRDYRDILSVCTRFPRAGERNVKVEEFVDMCVAVWEASGAAGEHAGWVVDILWWATRLTFNSHRVFRHMARICGTAGDFALAKRTLRLYAQMVGKARESGADCDTDENWVTTLVWGARMLCRLALAEEPSKDVQAIEDAREAGEMIDKAKTRINSDDVEQKALVELAEGIWNTVMAIVEQDHLTRMSRLTAALTHFQSSIDASPSAAAHYHLALAYYRPIPKRNLTRALVHARSAVELEPSEIRYWHVLGLLLVAEEDWAGARGVLEVGAAIDEQFWSGESPEQKAAPVTITVNGDGTTDTINGNSISDAHGETARHTDCGGDERQRTYARHRGRHGERLRERRHAGGYRAVDGCADGRCIQLDSTAAHATSSLLEPLPDHPRPTRPERFEQALQLRMTQLALTELVEGPEGAGEKWIEVFEWFAQRKGVGKEQSRRTSMDTSRQSMEIKSENGRANPDAGSEAMSNAGNDVDGDDCQYPTAPIPITFTPATPMHPGDSNQAFDENEAEKTTPRNSSDDKEKPAKKVQKMLKSRVHKGQQRITTIGKKIGHGVGRGNSLSLRRSSSTPQFYNLVGQSYQASSIHSRRQFSPFTSTQELPRPESPPPPPPPAAVPREDGDRPRRERRLLSDLWLMSAATFRRSGKVEQARAAIQEAEVRDEENPNVWVQFGLYNVALGHRNRGIQAFNKALFLAPDHIPATIHLCQQYLSSPNASPSLSSSPLTASAADDDVEPDYVDLAVGMLTDLTKGPGWDVAEAWYFLGRAHGMRGIRDRERECLSFALGLAEGRVVRDVARAHPMQRIVSAATVTTTGLLCKAFLNLGLASVTVNGLPTLMNALNDKERALGRGVVTVSNHISTLDAEWLTRILAKDSLDDPLAWGVLPARTYWNTRMTRWSLGAADIIFTNPRAEDCARREVFSRAFFRNGQVLKTVRGDGIYQPALDSAIEKLQRGQWVRAFSCLVHLFGEGKVCQSDTYVYENGKVKIPRFKWGIGRILMETTRPPVIIPVWLTGFDKLMPEGRKAPWKFIPRVGTQLSVTFGEPIPPEDIKAALEPGIRHGEGDVRSWVTDTGVVPSQGLQARDMGAEEESRLIRSAVTAVVQQRVEALGSAVQARLTRGV
ncbi:hypothetical protein EVG20_g2925 [Dentipellis fragilis]|uniref:Phospholipid/glycerol acyltransferase domain-containing protein n=1 Tax=Dentipellis fragilis TaxID=205917 RepID=A0A4Y9Z5F8_9AGAM|nr:hypothetical protein EVG20_g2925 [Dentipellis fragilis]